MRTPAGTAIRAAVSFLLLLILLSIMPDAAQAAQSGWQAVGQVGGPTQGVAVQGQYAYIGVGLRLVVLDISNPSDLREVGVTRPFPHFVQDVAVSGTLAYVAAGAGGLWVVDVSNPSSPLEVGAWKGRGFAEGVAVVGSTVCLADGSYGLRILDVSDRTKPIEVGAAYVLNYAFKVVVHGHYAYVAAAGAGLLISDVSDPKHPVEASSFDTAGYAYGVAVAGNTAYVADGWEGLKIVDVADPTHPLPAGAYPTPGWAFGVTVSGTRAYLADGFRGLRVIDIADPKHPAEVASTEMAGGHAGIVALSGNLAFVADRNWGLRVFDVTPPADGSGTLSQVGGFAPMGIAHGVTVSAGYAYVAAGPYGLRIVDIADPARPSEVGAYDTDSYADSVAVVGDYAYVASNISGSTGLHIVDVRDRARPVRAGFLANPHGSNRDLAVSGDVVYMPDERGLQLVDVSNPQVPKELAWLDLRSLGPYGTVGIDVSGGLAYVTAEQLGVIVVDVRVPSSPFVAGTSSWPGGMAEDIVVAGQYAYVAGGGAAILDLSDPLRPKLAGNYDLPIWGEGIAQAGDLVFVANGGSGVRVIDVSTASAPTLLATIPTAAYAQRVAVHGDFLYVADRDGGLLILEKSAAVAGVAHTPVVGARPLLNMVRPPVPSNSSPTPKPRKGRDLSDRAALAAPPAPNAVSACAVASAADSGDGTLRRCLENVTSGGTITFDPVTFPPGRPSTIALSSPLPNLDRGGVTIDASNAGVILDGSGLPVGAFGLFLVSDGNSVMGLQVVRVRGIGIVVGGSGNRIGGDRTRGTGPLGEGNLISGNAGHGVMINMEDANDNIVTGNLIGTDVSGMAALGNANNGIVVANGAHGNRIGGTTPGERNIISGNEWNGIALQLDVDNTTVIGNYIGVNASGTLALGNGDAGVSVGTSNHNRIGGTAGAERNVIGGNGGHGVSLNSTATGNLIIGNYVGLSAAGDSALGNHGAGIGLENGAYANLVANNVVGLSGNFGILLNDWGSSYNTVVGNLVGVDASGSHYFPGGAGGVWIGMGAAFNRIGGTAAAERNVIAGTAVFARMGAVGNLLLGNFIGTDITGTRGFGVSGPGIELTSGAQRPFIGGSAPGEGNVIGGNELGIRGNPGGNYALIAGNSIGVDATGVIPMGNRGDGISLAGMNNVVQGNRIAFNGGSGVGAPSSITIRANSIFGNTGPGIVSPGPDAGGVALPEITAVMPTSVIGKACAGCDMEVFSDSDGQGRFFEGSVIADAAGAFKFDKASSLVGPNITTTATDTNGSTSWFSVPIRVLLTALTYAASNITAGTATLNGTVNPSGLATMVWFEWGTNTAYGNKTISQSIGNGTNLVGISADLTGLARGTTYHYRIMASSSAGTANGADISFSTALTGGTPRLSLSVTGGGATTGSTLGTDGPLKAGYAVVNVNSGNTPYGTAVFAVTQNGVVVSEAAVPASPPTTAIRVFVDYRTGVATKVGQANSKTVDIYTGLALVNPGTVSARLTLQLRDVSGAVLTTGHLVLGPHTHNALFINEVNKVAPDFTLPSNFPTAVGFATLDVTSDQPVSTLALRLTATDRNETLLTTTPIVDLTKPLATTPAYFPHFADGGDYRTALYLMNTSNSVETGTVRFVGNNGAPVTLHLTGDPGDASPAFPYSIRPGGCAVLISDGAPAMINSGSVQVAPDAGSYTPPGAGVFSYAPGGALVTESGIPSAMPTTRARIYIDMSNGHHTGLAIAAPSSALLHVRLNAFAMDGITPAGSGSVDLPGNGHEAKFDYQFIPSLPDGFTGVLEISSSSPFVALTLRSLANARGDFLLTTFPIADFNQTAPAPMVFPQIADGGGYRTEFILLSSGGGATSIFSFLDDRGSPLPVGK